MFVRNGNMKEVEENLLLDLSLKYLNIKYFYFNIWVTKCQNLDPNKQKKKKILQVTLKIEYICVTQRY